MLDSKPPWKKDSSSKIMDDHDYWMVIENLLGWQLFGFTHKASASYATDKYSNIRLTGKQRDDIVNAIMERVNKNG
jgi:hypothetical protein